MNRFIFDTMTFLNGLLAVITVIAFTFVGLNHPMMVTSPPLGALLGFIAGTVLAALLCGAIAFMALIEQHMRAIAETRAPTAPYQAATRREPSL